MARRSPSRRARRRAGGPAGARGRGRREPVHAADDCFRAWRLATRRVPQRRGRAGLPQRGGWPASRRRSARRWAACFSRSRKRARTGRTPRRGGACCARRSRCSYPRWRARRRRARARGRGKTRRRSCPLGSTGVIPIDSESRRDAAAAGDDDAFAYFLWELPLFAALAAVAAAIGATLTRVSGAIAPHRPKQPSARVLEASLVAGVCAAIAVLAAAALGACSSRPETGAGAAEGSANDLHDADAAFRLGCPRGGAGKSGRSSSVCAAISSPSFCRRRAPWRPRPSPSRSPCCWPPRRSRATARSRRGYSCPP